MKIRKDKKRRKFFNYLETATQNCPTSLRFFYKNTSKFFPLIASKMAPEDSSQCFITKSLGWKLIHDYRQWISKRQFMVIT